MYEGIGQVVPIAQNSKRSVQDRFHWYLFGALAVVTALYGSYALFCQHINLFLVPSLTPLAATIDSLILSNVLLKYPFSIYPIQDIISCFLHPKLQDRPSLRNFLATICTLFTISVTLLLGLIPYLGCKMERF
jgi:hypothetical protein